MFSKIVGWVTDSFRNLTNPVPQALDLIPCEHRIYGRMPCPQCFQNHYESLKYKPEAQVACECPKPLIFFQHKERVVPDCSECGFPLLHLSKMQLLERQDRVAIILHMMKSVGKIRPSQSPCNCPKPTIMTNDHKEGYLSDICHACDGRILHRSVLERMKESVRKEVLEQTP